MYDPADTPFEIYVHASTLSTTGAAMTREPNRRIKSLSQLEEHPTTHLALPRSTLRQNGGVMAGKTNTPAPSTSAYPAAHHYHLPSTLSRSNASRFSTSNLPSVLDQYVLQNRANPAPDAYRLPEHKVRAISIGTATRPIFRRNQAADTPGPNQYNVNLLESRGNAIRFGKVPTYKPNLTATCTPGPGTYTINDVSQQTSRGLKISDAQLPSEADLVIRRGIPGPASYTLPNATLNSNSAKFSVANVPTALDRIISESKKNPAPGEYHSTYLMNHGRRTTGSGKMSTAYPKSNLDWIAYRSKQCPAPDAYNINATSSLTALLRHDPRGRFSQSKVPSFTDYAVARAKDAPAPSEYIGAPSAKDFTMKRAKSAAFIMATRTERFPSPRRDENIIQHPLWHTFKSVPDRPGDYSAPSYTMGQRFYTEEALDRSIHSPSRINIPDAFGIQVRSDKPSNHGFSFNGGNDNKDVSGDTIDSLNLVNLGPGQYQFMESYMKTYGKKDWSGKEAVKKAKLKKARKNLWKWRSERNMN